MTSLRWFVVPEVLGIHVVPLSEEFKMVPDVPTDTNLLFAKVTPQRLFDVEVMICFGCPSGIPTATNFPPEEEEVVSSSPGVPSEMVKEVTDSVLLAFPSESVTIIVQSE